VETVSAKFVIFCFIAGTVCSVSKKHVKDITFYVSFSQFFFMNTLTL